MDVTSYLLGKKAGGGSTPNLQEKSATITTNTTTEIEADEGYDGLSKVNITTNVSGGGVSDYFTSTITNGSNSVNGITKMIKTIPADTQIDPYTTTARYMFANCINLTSIPLIDTSNITNMGNMFQSCANLTTIPKLNTSRVTNFARMFASCTNLQTIPVLDLSSATSIEYMFSDCANLTNDGLKNILDMCIGATSYTGTKTTSEIGLASIYNFRIPTLSNYQDFLDAGWTVE